MRGEPRSITCPSCGEVADIGDSMICPECSVDIQQLWDEMEHSDDRDGFLNRYRQFKNRKAEEPDDSANIGRY